VVLVDEYDKPILDQIGDPGKASANREVLRGFYGILKSMDPFLQFTMFTGVSKFGKTSIFSGLDNLHDITLTEEYSNICGIGIEELSTFFGEHIKDASKAKALKDISDLGNEILAWCDGYSWDGETRVINPFSPLSFFKQKRFSSFWFASGSPKFLIDLIEDRLASYLDMENIEISEWSLDVVRLENIPIASLMFQTGYLTIGQVRYDLAEPTYLLRIPNYEVQIAFNMHMLAMLTKSGEEAANKSQIGLQRAFESGDLDKALAVLKSLFASIPYQIHIGQEAYCHSIFYAVLKITGFDIQADVSTARGRVDAILDMEEYVYIIELKYEDCPAGASGETKQKLDSKVLAEGIAKIKKKGYHTKYTGSGKKIILASFAFLGRDNIDMAYEEL